MIGRHDRNSWPITPWRLRDEHTTMCTLEQAKTISRDAWYLSRLRCIYSMSLPAFLCHNRWVSTTERTRRKSRTYHDASLRGAHPTIHTHRKKRKAAAAGCYPSQVRPNHSIELYFTAILSSESVVHRKKNNTTEFVAKKCDGACGTHILPRCTLEQAKQRSSQSYRSSFQHGCSNEPSFPRPLLGRSGRRSENTSRQSILRRLRDAHTTYTLEQTTSSRCSPSVFNTFFFINKALRPCSFVRIGRRLLESVNVCLTESVDNR